VYARTASRTSPATTPAMRIVRFFPTGIICNKRSSLSDQIDIAIDLGVVPPPLPGILNLRQLVESAPAAPPQIIEGVLHQGCKLILGGTSKSNKSWCLLDLAVSVASGEKWWGRRCAKMPVVYINFELHVWAIAQRLSALCSARPECVGLSETLHVWNLRGRNADLTLLRPRLEEQLARHEFGLIILDPVGGLGPARFLNSSQPPHSGVLFTTASCYVTCDEKVPVQGDRK